MWDGADEPAPAGVRRMVVNRAPRKQWGVRSVLVVPPIARVRNEAKELADQLTRMLKESIEKSRRLSHELMPAVVIMDVAMPMMPGDEAARRIKATLPQTRIINLSMFEEPGVAQRMRDAGAEVYLPKTGPSEGLLAAIRGRG